VGLATLVVNKIRGVSPESGRRKTLDLVTVRKAMLEDITVLTGGIVIRRAGYKLEAAADYLGTAEKSND